MAVVDRTRQFSDRIFVNRVIDRIEQLFLYDLMGEPKLNTELFDFVLYHPGTTAQIVELLMHVRTEDLTETAWAIDLRKERQRREIDFVITTPSGTEIHRLGDAGRLVRVPT